MITCYSAGVEVAWEYLEFTGTTTTYTQFEIPFDCSSTPDSMRIDFYSSSGDDVGIANVGSALILDDVELASDASAPTGINESNAGALSVYPNPATTEVNFVNVDGTSLDVTNVNGQVVESISINGLSSVTVNTMSYAAGVYFYTLSNVNGVTARGKFSVAK